MSRFKKRLGIVLVIILLILLIVLGFLAGNRYYQIGFSRENTVWTERYPEAAAAERIGTQMPDADWLTKAAYNEVRISQDGLLLHGYLVNRPDSDRYALVAHGYRGDAESMAAYGARFYELGYNVLLPDLRGCGKSEGDTLGLGWVERKDIAAWCNYLVKQREDAKVVLFGLSTGGAAALLSVQSGLPKQVSAIIADSSYAELQTLFRHQIKKTLRLPAQPLLTFLSNMVSAKAAYSVMTDGSVVKSVEQAHLPILFLGGSADDTLPPNTVQSLYDSHPSEQNELCLIEGAGHNAAALTDSDTYWQTVSDFLSKNIG